eukprot:Tbor_TRINITY_DN3773_c0_g1::TRINITY_DN3773_c0_g1_i2::g.2418::m.2418
MPDVISQNNRKINKTKNNDNITKSNKEEIENNTSPTTAKEELQKSAGDDDSSLQDNDSSLHPVALYILKLFMPMSITDQIWGMNVVNLLLRGVTVISFIISCFIGRFAICMYSIIATGALCVVIFGLNWRQINDDTQLTPTEEDPDLPGVNNWVNEEVISAYYKQYTIAIGERVVAEAVVDNDDGEKEVTEGI